MTNNVKFAICLTLLLVLVLIFRKTTERMHEFGRALTNLDDSYLAQLKFTESKPVEQMAPDFADVLENQYTAEQNIEHMRARCPVNIDPLETTFMNKIGMKANHDACSSY